MILYADCGNTAVKLALGSERARLDPTEVAAWIRAHPISSCILLPGAQASSQILRAACLGLPLREVGKDIHPPDFGQYPGFGLDRLCAALAAPIPAIVIDAGTATTLTAWLPGPRFAGGLILPGVHALIAGLACRAPALPEPLPLPPDAPASQQNTRNAIAAAAGIGHPAMVRACLERLRQETGIADCIVTGGGASSLLQAGLGPRISHLPDLVLDGLHRLS